MLLQSCYLHRCSTFGLKGIGLKEVSRYCTNNTIYTGQLHYVVEVRWLQQHYRFFCLHHGRSSLSSLFPTLKPRRRGLISETEGRKLNLKIAAQCIRQRRLVSFVFHSSFSTQVMMLAGESDTPLALLISPGKLELLTTCRFIPALSGRHRAYRARRHSLLKKNPSKIKKCKG